MEYCMRDFGNDEFLLETRPKRKRGKIIFVVIIAIIFILACVAYISFLNEGIGKFGTDYWFEIDENGKEVLKTLDGWTHELNIIKNYTLDGIILGTHHYYMHETPYQPENVFSPVDILVGVDDVAENVSKYDYHITSYKNREVKWYLYYDNYEDFEYFKTHTGNNHLIPHNNDAYSMMLKLEKYDKFLLSGQIVEIDGSKDGSWFKWDSDTEIGNYACEVILVDYIALK